jgi:FKBP-type peptidyl-prolyl cis-trans isomerase SlyD
VIIKVGRFNVDVDNNHPLADKTIIFDINIERIRNATADEISHGHTHGIDGHDHH